MIQSPDESQNITKMTERRALMSQQTSRESKSDHVKKLKDLTDSSDNSGLHFLLLVW